MYAIFTNTQGIAEGAFRTSSLFPGGILLHHLLIICPINPVYPFCLGSLILVLGSRELNVASVTGREHAECLSELYLWRD